MQELRFSGDDMLYATTRMKLCRKHLSAFKQFSDTMPTFKVQDGHIAKIAQTPNGECPICYLNLPGESLAEMPVNDSVQ